MALAKVKYKKGGKVKYEKGGEVKKYKIPELTKNQKKAAKLIQEAADNREKFDPNDRLWDVTGKKALDKYRYKKAADVMAEDTKERVAKQKAAAEKKVSKEEELTASQKEALQELKYKEMDKKMQKAAKNAPTTKSNMGKYAKGGKVTLRKSRDGIARKGHTRAT
tara:strand:- start:422 stop:916 length:495 start_codon:yes stop_codon:yes gene_type:complete